MRTVFNKPSAGIALAVLLAAVAGATVTVFAQEKIDKEKLKQIREAPRPPVITPGEVGTQSGPGRAPSDAIVLFAGKDLSKWIARGRSVPKGTDGTPTWKIQDGYMEIVPNSGNLISKEKFGDCQIHVEWASPEKVSGEGQHRGNSGVYLLGHCEIQVLDSYQNDTYPDGQAGGIYHHYAPLVNPSRKPGEWQSFDIIYKSPRHDSAGKMIAKARVTVIYNGIVIQNDVEVPGDDKECNLMLQDHLNPVRFRNIWVRKLPAAR